MNNNLITYTTPESVGVSSEKIEQFIKRLEDKQLATHSLILARGNQIFFEHYWEPFHREFQHRMYSVSKSFVSLAIGFLEQDGKSIWMTLSASILQRSSRIRRMKICVIRLFVIC